MTTGYQLCVEHTHSWWLCLVYLVHIRWVGTCAGDVCVYVCLSGCMSVCVCVCECKRLLRHRSSVYTVCANSYVFMKVNQVLRYKLHICVDMHALKTVWVYVCEITWFVLCTRRRAKSHFIVNMHTCLSTAQIQFWLLCTCQYRSVKHCEVLTSDLLMQIKVGIWSLKYVRDIRTQ